jgi:hypothetical protein
MIGSSYKSLIADLSTKMAKLWEQAVTNSAQFEELRKTTKECLSEFKHVVEACEAEMRAMERRHNEKERHLLTKVQALEERLNMLSEQALHRAVEARAEEYVVAVIEKISEKYVRIVAERLDGTLIASPPSRDSLGAATENGTAHTAEDVDGTQTPVGDEEKRKGHKN